ncbi:hypothetical protein Tco_0907113 [Tanacetum coccineum]|uniref:Uncharacterized protein n=1 Tax=Tanacetum coccineum TaxID=301880 RepID=A0ABQ5CKM5_9ASTR
MSWFSRCSWCGGPFNGGNCRHCTNVSFGNEPVYDSNPNSYNQTPDISNPPSQPLTSSFNQFHCFHCKDMLEEGTPYVSYLDEPDLLVTHLSDANEDECFDPGGEIDEIDVFLDMDISTDIENGYHNSEGDIIYLKSLLINDTIPNLHPEVFLDHDPRSLKDELYKEDLKSMVKVFDPSIHENTFSPTYVSLPFEDRHYLSFTYVIRIFLLYFTYLMESPVPFSSGSEDIIFDPGISAFHFSLEPVAFKCPMEVCSSTCFDCPDYKDSHARGFVHRPLDLLSFA